MPKTCVNSLETFSTNAQPLFGSFQNKLVTSMFLKLKTSAIIFIALINEDYKKKSLQTKSYFISMHRPCHVLSLSDDAVINTSWQRIC